MLTDEERKTLVANKVRRSRETWTEAKGIIANGYWYAAANRLYYACYYMVSALLLKKGVSANTHGGVIGLFGLHFIKSGVLSHEMGKLYSQLFELRQSGDYDDWNVVTENDIKPLEPQTETFLNTLEDLIRQDGYL